MSDASYGTNAARKNKVPVHFKISQFVEFIHSIGKRGKVLCKTSIGGLMPPECFTIRIPEKSIHPAKELSMPTETAYKSKVPINAKKYVTCRKFFSMFLMNTAAFMMK